MAKVGKEVTTMLTMARMPLMANSHGKSMVVSRRGKKSMDQHLRKGLLAFENFIFIIPLQLWQEG
jgi:hypothetical protein